MCVYVSSVPRHGGVAKAGLERSAACRWVRHGDLHQHVEAPSAHQSLIQQVRTVGGAHHKDLTTDQG